MGRDFVLHCTAEEIAAKLLAEPHREFEIYFHVTPDGDAVGSGYALAMALQATGAKARPVCADPVPAIYAEVIAPVREDIVTDPVRIAVDSATPARIATDAHITFCIDHHNGNIIDADYSFIRTDAASCAQLVYRVVLAMGVEITPALADLLYTGIATDTECFRRRNVSYEALQTAADLVKYGADASGLAKRFFRSKSRARMAAEQCMIASFRYLCGGRVVSACMTYDDLQRCGLRADESEGMNAITDQLAGVRFGIVVRETSPHVCRISVRADKGLQAYKIAEAYGGGGHASAAGAVTEGDPAEIRASLEQRCIEALQAYDDTQVLSTGGTP